MSRKDRVELSQSILPLAGLEFLETEHNDYQPNEPDNLIAAVFLAVYIFWPLLILKSKLNEIVWKSWGGWNTRSFGGLKFRKR